ncbi:hypothetical protein [Paenibacillus dendritiformis]|uniref:hypothetical protein n=1 Tax=Paenibacillus dendritiformis TaxID=130049 RepID=UPI00387E030C
MRQCRGGHEAEKKIAECFKLDPAASSFDVRDQVMKRVYRIHRDRQAKGNRSRRMTRRTFLIVTGIIVALTSLTGFAATRYFQIVNEKGRAVINTLLYPKKEEENRKNESVEEYYRRMKEYWRQIENLARPGEILAYYIDDDVINKHNTLDKVKIITEPLRFKSYNHFLRRVPEKMRARIVLPERLTDSIRFVEGLVHADQNFGEKPADAFAIRTELAEQFEQEANKNKDGRKIFTKPLPWFPGTAVTIIYSDGQSKLDLYAAKLTGINRVETPVTSDMKVEKIKVNGREVIFRDATASDEIRIKYGAQWYDEKNKYYYSLGVDKEGKLSKQDFMEALEASVTKP